MIKMQRTGVGVVSHPAVIRDSDGTGLLPIQVQADPLTTIRINGRVSPDAPWVEIRAAQETTSFLETISYVPELQLEITSGTGTAFLWVGEK